MVNIDFFNYVKKSEVTICILGINAAIKHARKALVPKYESFSSYLKDLKLTRFSDIWTINKIHKFLVHELKMRLKLLHFMCKYFAF